MSCRNGIYAGQTIFRTVWLDCVSSEIRDVTCGCNATQTERHRHEMKWKENKLLISGAVIISKEMHDTSVKMRDRIKCWKDKRDNDDSTSCSCPKLKISKEAVRRFTKWFLGLTLGICAMWQVWGECMKFYQASFIHISTILEIPTAVLKLCLPLAIAGFHHDNCRKAIQPPSPSTSSCSVY